MEGDGTGDPEVEMEFEWDTGGLERQRQEDPWRPHQGREEIPGRKEQPEIQPGDQ